VRPRLTISEACPLILAHHVALDRARETAKGAGKIGTTGRGIGPAYEDKVARRAIRMQDLFHRERLAAKLGEVLDFHNFVLRQYFGVETVDFQSTLDELLALADQVKPMVGDVPRRLFEAQGGKTYCSSAKRCWTWTTGPTFVTSSNCVAGAAAAGSGVGPQARVHSGHHRGYTTRVGSGPFPTELEDEIGRQIAVRGNEVGATTGRPRRCGWFDAAALKRSIQINGVSGLCITKLDVLDGMETLQIGVGYRVAGEYLDILPVGAEELAECEPIYEELPGWAQSTLGVRRLEDLPRAARHYLERIEVVCGVPLDLISTGAERDDTIVRRHPFEV
jgi:adenylosuccinate synthase